MTPTVWIDSSDVRHTWSGYPETAAVLRDALRSGWRLSKQGHGGRLYCPIEHDPDHRHHQFSVAGSPRNDGREARRIRTLLRTCDSGA